MQGAGGGGKGKLSRARPELTQDTPYIRRTRWQCICGWTEQDPKNSKAPGHTQHSTRDSRGVLEGRGSGVAPRWIVLIGIAALLAVSKRNCRDATQRFFLTSSSAHEQHFNIIGLYDIKAASPQSAYCCHPPASATASASVVAITFYYPLANFVSATLRLNACNMPQTRCRPLCVAALFWS